MTQLLCRLFHLIYIPATYKLAWGTLNKKKLILFCASNHGGRYFRIYIKTINVFFVREKYELMKILRQI